MIKVPEAMNQSLMSIGSPNTVGTSQLMPIKMPVPRMWKRRLPTAAVRATRPNCTKVISWRIGSTVLMTASAATIATHPRAMRTSPVYVFSRSRQSSWSSKTSVTAMLMAGHR